MDTITTESMSYVASALAKFFHSWPHYSLEFTPVSPVFNPEYKPYQESLLVIAAVPVVWMLLWILIYMLYFCYYCVTCRRRTIEKAQRSGRPTRWCAFFFSVLAIVVLTVSIFGTELVDHSLSSVDQSISGIKGDADKAAIQSAVILREIDLLNNETRPYLNRQFRISGQFDEETLPTMLGYLTMLQESLDAANTAVQTLIQAPMLQLEIDNSKFSHLIDEYEMYRRIVSHAVSGFVMLTTCIALCALGSRRKGFLLSCVAISIFNLMIVWSAAGFYSGLTVATADFCVDPTGYVINSNSPADSNVEESLRYYLECDTDVNPSHQAIVTIQGHIDDADSKFQQMIAKGVNLDEEVKQNMTDARDDIVALQEMLLQLGSYTDCTSSHTSYMAAINSICYTSLFGEVAILCSFTLAGLLLIILVFLIHASARLHGNRNGKVPEVQVSLQPITRRRRRAYFEVDSQDHDYQSRAEHNRSDNPLYYRFSQISTTDDNTRAAVSTNPSGSAQPSAPSRSSPPPAYQNHKDFYSTYGNNGTLDSNTRAPTASNDLNRNSNTFRT